MTDLRRLCADQNVALSLVSGALADAGLEVGPASEFGNQVTFLGLQRDGAVAYAQKHYDELQALKKSPTSVLNPSNTPPIREVGATDVGENQRALPRWLKVETGGRVDCDATPSAPVDYDHDFDELVIDYKGNCWLHVEMLGDLDDGSDQIFVYVAGRRIWLNATKDGVREEATEIDSHKSAASPGQLVVGNDLRASPKGDAKDEAPTAATGQLEEDRDGDLDVRGSRAGGVNSSEGGPPTPEAPANPESGEVGERLMPAVLKTATDQESIEGSNPYFSDLSPVAANKAEGAPATAAHEGTGNPEISRAQEKAADNKIVSGVSVSVLQGAQAGTPAPQLNPCEAPDCKEPGIFLKDSGGFFCEKFHAPIPKSVRKEFHYLAHPELKPKRGRPPKAKAVSNV